MVLRRAAIGLLVAGSVSAVVVTTMTVKRFRAELVPVVQSVPGGAATPVGGSAKVLRRGAHGR